jgi:thioredoxin reductase
MNNNATFEVIIIGGSYAGMSAAMALGRSLRRTLILDTNEPCNRFTPHSHNFLTQDGKTPAEIKRLSREQLAQYPHVVWKETLAKEVRSSGKGWQVLTENQHFEAPLLIIATGLNDELPEWEGALACWGKTLIHCPYCHGYEGKQKTTALIARGDKAQHLIPLIYQLTPSLTLLTNGEEELPETLREQLNKKNIPIDSRAIHRLEHQNGQLKKIHFHTGQPLAMEMAYGVFPVRQKGTFIHDIGVEVLDNGFIKVDGMQQTNREGVLACGDATGMMRSVAAAISSGQMAGAMANKKLAEAQFFGN